ncbi:DNA-binding transcriptional regulator, XRE-family HTH domain [Streptomyces sp. TLI_053]|uniref:helix-turn-helix transcriptional regulator n=1 Tax=Streptomyces sp. TLI_053 TaxID=1855352 RepID=UPI000879DEBC|nr:helix-turn-helix transcriptional regulator [Streptomyces sp. TLI_053]SDT06295.1 DNA-binding transcriptional regulator, XRE-family HTH domain [Streptomyces sp. TLI_053]
MDDQIRHPLAYARALRGWSQTDLAARIHRAARNRPEGLRSGADKAAVSKWENWRKTPGIESQLLIAEAFDVPIADLEACEWPHWLPGQELPVPLGSAFTVLALRDAQRAAMDHRRRTFMAFSALALAGLSTQWAALEPDRLTTTLNGKRVDAELVDWLEGTSAELTALPTEQRQHTAKLMDAQLDTVTDLLEQGRYTESIGQRLHLLAASLASTCGWHRFDQGQHHAAGKLWNAALTNAHAAHDRDLGAGVLSDFAYQSIWLTRPDAAVEPLSQALIHTRHPTARSLLHLRRARAHAALGAASYCRRDLAAAETALLTDSPDPAPAWCRWMSTADLAVDSGQCMLDLGHVAEAHTRIDEGMSLLPRSRDKTRGIFLTYEARSLLQARDVEQALAVTNQALDLATRIGADRCVTLVRELAPAFKPYCQVDGVADLMDRLRVS